MTNLLDSAIRSERDRCIAAVRSLASRGGTVWVSDDSPAVRKCLWSIEEIIKAIEKDVLTPIP